MLTYCKTSVRIKSTKEKNETKRNKQQGGETTENITNYPIIHERKVRTTRNVSNFQKKRIRK